MDFGRRFFDWWPLVAVPFGLIFIVATAAGGEQVLASTGEEIFRQHCVRCHGVDGTRGMFGAKNLQKSVMADAAVITQITKGEGFMPEFGKKLSAEEIWRVADYVKTLRRVKR